MGTYASGKKRQRSVSDTLAEAEHDHFLDCPNADFFIRVGGTLLDGILFFLMFSGIHHISTALSAILPQLPEVIGTLPLSIEQLRLLTFYSAKVLQLSLIYVYFLWTVASFGGTPAKLLLGLRVVDATSGQKLSIPQALLRELARLVSLAPVGIGCGLAFVRKDRLAFHDLMTNTVVKRVHGGP